jgi:hypothetical protein
VGSIHHTTAAGTATGWMERSRPLPGSAVFASASPTATDLTCRLICATPALRGASLVRLSLDLIPQARRSRDKGRRA